MSCYSIEALIDARTLKKRCALVARPEVQQTYMQDRWAKCLIINIPEIQLQTSSTWDLANEILHRSSIYPRKKRFY